MKAAVVVRYTKPVVGREAKAIEYGIDVDKLYREYAADGRCSEPMTFISSQGHAMWIITGDEEELAKIDLEPDARRLATKGSLVLEGFGYEVMSFADSSDAIMGRYSEELAKL